MNIAVHPLAVSLARIHRDGIAFRVNQHGGRPGAYAVLLPDGKFRIVDDWMGDFVPQDCLPDVVRLPLIR